jgi:hypothetical protein
MPELIQQILKAVLSAYKFPRSQEDATNGSALLVGFEESLAER